VLAHPAIVILRLADRGDGLGVSHTLISLDLRNERRL
jgi:hypothetical protein